MYMDWISEFKKIWAANLDMVYSRFSYPTAQDAVKWPCHSLCKTEMLSNTALTMFDNLSSIFAASRHPQRAHDCCEVTILRIWK